MGFFIYRPRVVPPLKKGSCMWTQEHFIHACLLGVGNYIYIHALLIRNWMAYISLHGSKVLVASVISSPARLSLDSDLNIWL